MIGKYVRALLEEGQEVVLPGFARLSLKEHSELPGSDEGRFLPPGRSIRIDSTHTLDNGLLASAYSKGEQLSDDEAVQQVLELVDAIRFALDTGESYPLQEVGVFSRDEDGRLVFTTDPSWQPVPEQYGLEPMDLEELDHPPLEDERGKTAEGPGEMDEAPGETAVGPGEMDEAPGETAEPPVDQLEDSGETAEPPVEQLEASGETAPPPEAVADGSATMEEAKDESLGATHSDNLEGHPEIPSFSPKVTRDKPAESGASVTQLAPPLGRQREPKTLRRSAKPWRAIFLVVVLLVIVLAILLMIPSDFISSRKHNKEVKQANKAAVERIDEPSGEQDGARKSSGEGQEETGGSAAGDAVDKGSAITNDEADETVVEPVYFLIAGSFQHLKNASECQDELMKLGYDGAEVMFTENRMYRVSVASFVSKKEAEEALRTLKGKEGLQGIWLLAN